jgi:hypothetical protein
VRLGVGLKERQHVTLSFYVVLKIIARDGDFVWETLVVLEDVEDLAVNEAMSLVYTPLPLSAQLFTQLPGFRRVL